jgi:DNA-binding IclR family transcriptional regulator
MVDVAGNVSRAGATVTSRALALIGAFDAGHRRLSLSQLADRAELPVPTAHRLVAELVAWGALSRTASGEYVVGRRLWDVGLLAPVNTGLRQLASPYLHDLYGATLATVHLAVREGDQALYLDRLSGHDSVPVVSTIGSRLPMHATGVGKVLLAHAPAAVQVDVLAHLTRITPYTINQPGTLRRQLARVLRDDYATTAEEMSLGACSVAVPIRAKAEVVASLGIVVPSLKKDRAKLVTAMQVTARSIGRALLDPSTSVDRFH